MAKKPANTASTALRDSLPNDIKVITVASGAQIQVDVDVNEMVIPYTIAFDGGVLIKSLVDRRAIIPSLGKGAHRLGWAFAHAMKDWKHRLAIRVGTEDHELEKRSEAAKDLDHGTKANRLGLRHSGAVFGVLTSPMNRDPHGETQP